MTATAAATAAVPTAERATAQLYCSATSSSSSSKCNCSTHNTYSNYWPISLSSYTPRQQRGLLSPFPQHFGTASGDIREAEQRLVDVLQAARSVFSDELTRNFPRNQPTRQVSRANPNSHITVICLPPGSHSVPLQTRLISNFLTLKLNHVIVCTARTNTTPRLLHVLLLLFFQHQRRNVTMKFKSEMYPKCLKKYPDMTGKILLKPS